MRHRRAWRLAGLGAALLAGGLLLPAPASAATIGPPLPVALFGLPSLQSIIQAIANDFFGALAGALVPSWLKHGTVATIQHLVALPDPASWRHVSRLQGEMTYLGAMLLPVTLAIGATRYWLVGLTGSAHPASAIVRCAASSGVLVAYRWIVEQTVAAVNTVTHGILGLPAVSEGLARIIGVLFGGALLTGAGSVFGAFLVIVGVVFAAGLFAAQVLLTVALAVLIVAGPPLIALAAIPELSHLARGWADALLAVALVPLGWTVLFATAGALCLDATSFTGAGGGLPGHVAAAFAGLITFVLAVRLPMMAVGEIRSIFSRHGLRSSASNSHGNARSMPGGERVRTAQARLRAVGLQAVPSFGASVGRAAGALGAPAGGPIGAARRRIARARRSGVFRNLGHSAAGAAGTRGRPSSADGIRPGVRERFAQARRIHVAAPAEAAAAMNAGSRRARNVANKTWTRADRSARGPAQPGDGRTSSNSGRTRPRATASGAGKTQAYATRTARTSDRGPGDARGARAHRPPRASSGPARTSPRAPSATSPASATLTPAPPDPPQMHPAGKLAANTRRDAASTASTSRQGVPATPRPSKKGPADAKPARAAPAATQPKGASAGASRRKPRPRSRP